jgi:hypothetical protein
MTTLLVVITVFCWLWLWFMVKKPARWGMMVDRENAFWVSKGIVSASFAEKFKRFEKGRGQKVLVCAAAVVGTAGYIAITLIILVHR